MKIVFLVSEYIGFGGTDTTLIELVKYFRSCGDHVSVWSRGNRSRHDLSSGLIDINLFKKRGCYRAVFFIHQILKKLGILYFRKILGEMEARQIGQSFDVVYGIDQGVQEILSAYRRRNINCLSVWACLDLPMSFGVGVASQMARNNFFRKIRSSAMNRFEINISNGIDEIIVHSVRNSECVLSKYSRKAHLIYPGIEVEDNFLKRSSFWRDPSVLMIGCMSVLYPFRRYEDIIEAIAISPYRSKIKCIFAGSVEFSHDYYNDLRRLSATLGVESNIEWRIGVLSSKQRAEFYGSLDVFIWASHMQSWGCAVFEAAAAGALVLLSDTAGAGEVFKSGYDCYKFNACRPSSLSGTLNNCFENRDEANVILNRGQATALGFPWSLHAEKNRELLKALLDR